MKNTIVSFYSSAKQLLTETVKTALSLYKIMIPVSILVKALQYWNVIPWFGKLLTPVMSIVGLPFEAGLVWATTMLTNIYGGMIAFYELKLEGISQAEISILCCMMLVAHTLPVELQVARQAGIRLGPMFAFRFGFAILTAFVLHLIFSSAQLFQTKMATVPFMKPSESSDLISWISSELLRYLQIFVVVFLLLLMMKVLKKSGALDLMARSLKPLLKWLRMEAEVIPVLVVGLSLGILYGGALMIQEIKKGSISPRQVLYSFIFMGLCHSLIEDSLLMISMGAHWSSVFLFRMAIALLVTYGFIRLLDRISEETLQRYVMVKIKTEEEAPVVVSKK